MRPSSSFFLLPAPESDLELALADIGGKLYGKWMRWAILTAIVTSQVSPILTVLLKHGRRKALVSRPSLTHMVLFVYRSASSRRTPSLSCVARSSPSCAPLDLEDAH